MAGRRWGGICRKLSRGIQNLERTFKSLQSCCSSFRARSKGPASLGTLNSSCNPGSVIFRGTPRASAASRSEVRTGDAVHPALRHAPQAELKNRPLPRLHARELFGCWPGHGSKIGQESPFLPTKRSEACEALASMPGIKILR